MLIAESKQDKTGLLEVRSGDIIDAPKFNKLPAPVTARLCGGGEFWIETLCVQTGVMRVDVSGMIDRHHFSDVMVLIDINGEEYDPDDFWLDI